MAYHDEAFDCRRRRAIDGHGLRERPHGNHPRRIRRRVIKREVGQLGIRTAGGDRHLAKTRLGGKSGISSMSGRLQQRDIGHCHDKRKGTRSKEGTGEHGWISFGLGCAAGISRPKYPGMFARCRGGAMKCRSGAPDAECVREWAELGTFLPRLGCHRVHTRSVMYHPRD